MIENEWISYVRRFHETYDCPIRDTPTLDPDSDFLRISLISEELDELHEALNNEDLVGVADALGDLVYVVVGAALVYGIPLGEVMDEIQNSNMSKLDEQGNVIRREDGKILKGPNFVEPQLKEIIFGK